MTQKYDLSKTYRNRKVLVTGHTGFKGSWLSLWLNQLGAKVTGYALDPHTAPNLFELAEVGKLVEDVRGDIRDFNKLAEAINKAQPEIIFHLAAQAIVRESYNTPRETFDANVMGTVNCLEAARHCPSVKAVVVITSDKCYENKEWFYSYRENDELGGHDPYSASKAAAELVVSSYRKSFFQDREIGLASARAGNVIGGGDWSKDRIVPDIMRTLLAGQPVPVRSPQSVRPWQHVLEPLCGYLVLGANLLSGDGKRFSQAWNFGPHPESCRPVRDLVESFIKYLGQGSWQDLSSQNECAPHEAGILRLAWDKASHLMSWRPRWTFETTVEKTLQWYKMANEKRPARELCLRDIKDYTTGNPIFENA